MYYARLFVIALTASLLGSCEKESVESRADLLVNKNWQNTALTVTLTGNLNETQDVYALLPECQKDNYLRFNDNKTLESNEGAVLCDSTAQQTAGTWNLNPEENRLALTTETLAIPAALPFDIVELNASTLVLKSTVVQPDVTTVTLLTFTAQ